MLHSGRIAGRGREPDLASGEHDACRNGRIGAARAGIGEGLLRLSVGIEDAADLAADLSAGLERAAKAQLEPHRRRRAS